MLGDTAVAVHPEDERYKHLIGKTVILPLLNREIPVVADDYVDMEFGTGVVKITPAHDPNDFLVGERHNLERIVVMNDDATMNANAGKYQGMSRYDARKVMVEDLRELDLLVKIKDHVHNVGQCSRCTNVVEPMIKKQWFVKMAPLAKPAIDAVREGKTQFVPGRFDKIYFHWLENIQDWCISRQLWWGHRIPAYYCQDCGDIIVSKEQPNSCSKCSSRALKQDQDTLDTWFSSALWPFSTLGWPNQTEDLKYFYPTNVLVTGYDIIFFWVVRMMFSAIENTGEVPFDTVLIHGLVRDAQGRKMSKSLGNGVDPLDVIEQFGTDALRFMLATGNSPGNDMRFSTDRVEACRNFANKLWNASRYVLMNITEDMDIKGEVSNPDELSSADRWILSRINDISEEVTINLEKYEIGVAAQKLYDFVWNELCDWYIELSKPVLYSDDKKAKECVMEILLYTLTRVCKLLHPFMPFITEEIWQNLPQGATKSESIMIAQWPKADKTFIDRVAEQRAQFTMDVIRSIRNIRAEANVVPSKKVKVILTPEDKEKEEWIKGSVIYFEKLASASEVIVTYNAQDIPQDVISAVVHGAKIYLPLFELVDKEKEIERLEKEQEKTQKEIDRVTSKLNNQGFVSKAPAKVIEEEKEKQQKYQQIMDGILERLTTLKNK
jgi:valyl-tRNA synthetase